LRILVLISFILIYKSAVGQDPYYTIIDKSQGIPSNTIYNIYQDNDGFIWLATEEGLCRFDGKYFKSFLSKDLSSKAGSEIKQDGFNRIWYENFDGFLYYLDKDTLTKFEPHIPYGFNDYFLDGNHLMTISTDGLTLFDIRTKAVIKQSKLNIPTISFSRQIGNLFIIVSTKIQIYDSNANLLNTVELNEFKNNTTNIPALITGYKNNIYCISTSNEEGICYKISKNNKLIKALNVDNKQKIQNIAFTTDKIWLCTQDGLYVYDLKNKTNKGWVKLFDEINITDVFEDNEKRIWISTINKGIYQIPYMNAKIMLKNDCLKRVATKDEHTLCLDDKGSLISLEKDQKKISHINFPNQFLESGSYSKNIYISGSYFVSLDKNHAIQMNYPLAVKDILEPDSSYVILAASGIIGIIKNSGDHSLWESLFYKSAPIPYLKQIHVLKSGIRAKSLAMNKGSNEFYCSTNLGLFKFSKAGIATEIKTNNKPTLIGKISFLKNTLVGLDNNKSLRSFNLETSNKTSKVLLKGVYDYFIFDSILITKNSNSLTLYSVNSLNQLNPLSSIKTYNEEIRDLLLIGKTLYFINEKGLVSYEVENIYSNYTQDKFHIDEIIAKGKKVIQGEILPYDQNDVEIHFSILDLNGASNHTIKFRINHGSWKDIAESERSLRLLSLAGGAYSIEFMFDGMIKHDATFNFEILIPWWKKNWIMGIGFLILASIMFIYFRWQMRLYKRKNELQVQKLNLEKDLNKSILTSIKAQMNPHFFYNALNTVQSYIFTNDKKMASMYLSKFSKLTRMILEMSEKEKITLSQEIEALYLYLEIEKSRFDENFKFNINIDTEINPDLIKITPMLIQPFVENAIKHGLLHKKGEQNLSLDFKKNNLHLVVKVDDNGIGRKKSNEINQYHKNHYSYSTKANEKRLSILNNYQDKLSAIEITDKTDELGNSSGTTVILQIPL